MYPNLDTFVKLLPESLPVQNQDSKDLGRLEDALRRYPYSLNPIENMLSKSWRE